MKEECVGERAYSYLPSVSVVIPMKNEVEYIGVCLESIMGQEYPRELLEVIVVDGGSNDGSLGTVKQLMREHPNIKLMGGPGVNCPAGMNIGIKAARGQLISKIDAHGYVAKDFLRMSVEYLSKDAKIKCVGGPIRPVAENRIAKANALARSCMFGVGRGVYSMGEEPMFVNTVQCGVYKKDVFREIGLFDESLQFGEDEELNWRIRKQGYKIFATPEIKFFYFPRNSFRKLFRQYYGYGMTRVRVIRKHPSFFNLKHIIPVTLVLAVCITGTLAFFSSLFAGLLCGLALSYFVASLAFSAAISRKQGWQHFVLLPISFAALHLGYGTGFARGLVGLSLKYRIQALR